MPERRDPPPTDEGWFALHDFRTVDWDAWQAASDSERERALKEAIEHLQDLAALEDAEEGATAVYSVLGHKADLLFVHLRPSTAQLDAIERGVETTALARFLDQPTSYVSVTEASGYSERARGYFEGEIDENSGLANYIRSRLHPTIPDVEHVCFYPMDKRREPDQNWYSLPFEERAEHMDAHGDIGRDYAGKVTQMITGSIGLDDWEWGVTLWAEDMVDVKDLLYEMRFDASTAEFADFGPFYVGRRIAPTDLPAVLAGEPVPAAGESTARVSEVASRERAVPSRAGGPTSGSGAANRGRDSAEPGSEAGADAAASGDSTGSAAGAGRAESASSAGASGGPPPGVTGGDDGDTSAGPEATDAEDMTARLASLGLHEGPNFEPGQHGVICYSDADAQQLAEEVGELREQFDHYDSHVETAVRAQAGRSAVASLWETERAADTAAGFLVELPGVGESVTGPLGDGVGGRDVDSGADEGGADEGGVDEGGADEGGDDEGGADEGGDDAVDHADVDDGASDSTPAASADADAGAQDAAEADEGDTTAEQTTASSTDTMGVGAKKIAEAASAAAGSDASNGTGGDASNGTGGDASNGTGGDASTDADAAASEAGDADDETAEPAEQAEDEAAPDNTGPADGAAPTDDADADSGGHSTADLIRQELSEQNVYAGQPHGEDVYALVCYSQADVETLQAEVSDLADGFDRYDTHEGTDVYVDVQGQTAAVVSLWATEDAADTASDFLADLPGIVGWADEGDGFGTMGMFYTVKPEHREDFVATFAQVGELLVDMDGHRDTALLANVEDDNDMFIASQWDSQDDAMAFFRSEAFRDTVEWGRDVLADRPRHVFLA